PPASLGSTTNSGDPTSLDFFQIITPGTSGSLMFLDELRLGTAWADVTGTNGTPPQPSGQPCITHVEQTPDGLDLSGTNGTPNSFYRLLASSNLALAQGNWPAIETNTFDAN